MSVDESISRQVNKEVCISCLKFTNDGHQEELISLSTRQLVYYNIIKTNLYSL